jgi:DNA-binding GntR family transcriptional regulator
MVISRARSVGSQPTASRVSDQAFEKLRDMIIRLELAPGSTLSEASLTAQLGVGRSPLREALYRLAGEGLVVVSPRRNYFVAEISLQHVQQLFELRRELEVFCVRQATERATPAEIGDLEHLLARTPESGASEPGLTDGLDMDRAFHRQVWAMARNQYAEEMLARLQNLTVRVLYFAGTPQQGVKDLKRELGAIFEAIRQGNPEEAALLMADHFRAFQRQLLTSLLGLEESETGSRDRKRALHGDSRPLHQLVGSKK